ncbi:unnamed protein product [Rangifer tarandus platyrhynchus]|uniref:Uncharacterized protein n=1 Tax=Rangifer tarandus platyrhynchus TaxID=3082113 RepID=A0ABN8ZCV6_RANTA|nr:unnamed protein product [Rangifer tarandus platyrhynchus]
MGRGGKQGAPGLSEAVAVASSGVLDRSAQSWTRMPRERKQVGGRSGGEATRATGFQPGRNLPPWFLPPLVSLYRAPCTSHNLSLEAYFSGSGLFSESMHVQG